MKPHVNIVLAIGGKRPTAPIFLLSLGFDSFACKNKDMHNHPERHPAVQDIIERWKQSHLSQVQFCKQEGISYYKFQYWCRKLRRQANRQQRAEPDFVKLNIKEPVQTTAIIEIHFPGGQRLFFHQAVEPDYIKTLLG
ncbi:MAG: hypothetical protein M9933_18025 [Chitinophagaceae bacterium]|nr:hypothetical protein [Chitinophagaceae bacterium]